ncbi:MAG: long-chain N-acyl amino acid synthase [Burkholderiales bacterium]|nr:long-chain N-acyl amino acid synthase [Burkholderiales bacterium]
MSHTDNPADHWKQTIIGLPLDNPLRPLSLEREERADTHNISLSQQQFKIRLANSEGRRESASLLIKKMYNWRGYDTAGLNEDSPNRITLMADTAGVSIGTLTIGLDSPSGLLVDQLYHDEIDRLRTSGATVCEFTKLAVDQALQSKQVLAALFQLAYIYAHRIHGATDVVIEVNPRHVVFYKRMLGFEPLGETRMCPRVHAPAVLLHLSMAYAKDQIARYGGHFVDIPGVRSVYPYFLSTKDEDGISERLQRGD